MADWLNPQDRGSCAVGLNSPVQIRSNTLIGKLPIEKTRVCGEMVERNRFKVDHGGNVTGSNPVGRIPKGNKTRVVGTEADFNGFRLRTRKRRRRASCTTHWVCVSRTAMEPSQTRSMCKPVQLRPDLLLQIPLTNTNRILLVVFGVHKGESKNRIGYKFPNSLHIFIIIF